MYLGNAEFISFYMKAQLIFENLDYLYQTAPSKKITNRDSVVIFSDLHMGNGKKERDDFLHNSELFKYVLKHYYLQNNFQLFLNGDIEELQKFSFDVVQSKWNDVYQLFEEFNTKNRLFRIAGNHDFELFLEEKYNILPALKLIYKNDTMFMFHGHQASAFLEKYNEFAGFFLRYMVRPLPVRNNSTAYDSKRKYRVEKKVYSFSNKNKIVSIIGHTHRPLFESLSRIDYLKFKIEQLCRVYPKARRKLKRMIETDIKYYKNELEHSYLKDKKLGKRSSLYNSNIIVPCVFNSGCAIGKRGVTALEIHGGKIYLVHWFDQNKSKKYLQHHNYHIPKRLNQSDYYRLVIKEDHLNYIFTRIKLLA